MLDVFFLSYNEPFADEHFELLKIKAPHAKRVHGIKGIFNAHKECAKQSMTTHFYVVDADAIIESDFNFDYTPSPDINWFEGKDPLSGYGKMILGESYVLNGEITKGTKLYYHFLKYLHIL